MGRFGRTTWNARAICRPRCRKLGRLIAGARTANSVSRASSVRLHRLDVRQVVSQGEKILASSSNRSRSKAVRILACIQARAAGFLNVRRLNGADPILAGPVAPAQMAP